MSTGQTYLHPLSLTYMNGCVVFLNVDWLYFVKTIHSGKMR